MRRMYSESQLKRLITENCTKLYRHIMTLKGTWNGVLVYVSSGPVISNVSTKAATTDNISKIVGASSSGGWGLCNDASGEKYPALVSIVNSANVKVSADGAYMAITDFTISDVVTPL